MMPLAVALVEARHFFITKYQGDSARKWLRSNESAEDARGQNFSLSREKFLFSA
jgi:hypothetical protein